MKKAFLLLAAMTAFISESDATIRRVNNTVGMTSVYATLTSAINASSAGDTIHLEGTGIHYGSIYVNKRLVFIGPGYAFKDTVANPQTQAIKEMAIVELVLDPGSKGSVVQGLNLTGVYLSDSLITIQRNIISGTLNLGYNAHTYADTIRQNFITGNGAIRNVSNNQAKNLLIYNNIIENAGTVLSANNLNNTNGYFINNSVVLPVTSNSNPSAQFTCSNFTFQNNIFYTANFGTLQSSNIFVNNIARSGIPSGNNNLVNILPETVYLGWTNWGTSYSSDGRYKLSSTSPALGAGILNGNVVDCGAFGGSAPYILSGMPPVPSIYSFSVPNQVNSGTATINVSISAAAH